MFIRMQVFFKEKHRENTAGFGAKGKPPAVPVAFAVFPQRMAAIFRLLACISLFSLWGRQLIHDLHRKDRPLHRDRDRRPAIGGGRQRRRRTPRRILHREIPACRIPYRILPYCSLLIGCRPSPSQSGSSPPPREARQGRSRFRRSPAIGSESCSCCRLCKCKSAPPCRSGTSRAKR